MIFVYFDFYTVFAYIWNLSDKDIKMIFRALYFRQIYD